MSKGKKVMSVWLIIAIIVILLLLLGWFVVRPFFSSFSSSYQYQVNESFNSSSSESQDYGYDGGQTDPAMGSSSPESSSPVQDSPRDYETSDKLSTLTFSKVVDYIEPDAGYIWKANVNIKVTGYLQERNPRESRLNRDLDRWYSFKNSKVEWSITGSETKESDNCKFVYAIDSKGSKPIEELNIDSGDKKIDVVPVAGWGSWALAYAQNGFYTSTPEVSLEGYVLLPAVKTVTTDRLTDHSICGDYYATERHSVETMNFMFSPALSLKLINVDINKKDYTGSLQSAEDSFDTPEGSSAMFENARLDLLLDIPYDQETWNVNWDVHLP